MAKKKPVKKAAPKKKVGGRDHFISKAPLRRLMKDEGAGLVSEGALLLMAKTLEAHAKKVTKKAISIVKDEKRKRLTSQDITFAIR
ncbi:MAG: histone [Promethearchaeota archaeon]